MGNKSGNAYGLTVLSPITQGSVGDESKSAMLRDRLENLPLNEHSPLAKVPNTYLCRFYVLNDVFYQGSPANEEHLKSKYLVFSSNFYGDLNTYLSGMWEHANEFVRQVWGLCIGFDRVENATDFVAYIQKCQVKTTLFFNGSNDEPLDEQLKGLYLKQEFSKFVFDHQGKEPGELQQAFASFVKRTQPESLTEPTWQPGACNPDGG